MSTQHCCLASLISDFPPTGRKIDKATKTFLSKVSKGEEDSAEEMTLLTRLLGSEQEGFLSYDDPGATNDIFMERYKNPSACYTPPAKKAKKKKKKSPLKKRKAPVPVVLEAQVILTSDDDNKINKEEPSKPPAKKAGNKSPRKRKKEEATLSAEEGKELTPRRSIRVVEKMTALSAAPPQAAARMPVKTKAKKTVTAEKKRHPSKFDMTRMATKFTSTSATTAVMKTII